MQLSNTEVKYLQTIANMVDEYLKSKAPVIRENHQLFSVIDRCLPHITRGKRFHTTLVDVTTSKNPFIMRVFPDTEELYNKSEALFTAMNSGKSEEFFNAYEGIMSYHIEIDSRVLTKGHSLCVDDGNQFVAILCHEIGHVLFDNPRRLLENYMMQAHIMSKAAALMMNKNPIVRKLCLPMFLATARFKFIMSRAGESTRNEIAADAYVPPEFREDLITYFDNHILNSPERSSFVVTKEDYDNWLKTHCVFSNNVITNIKSRRKVLKSGFEQQYKTEESPYLKKFVKWLGNSAIGYDVEADLTNEVYESSVMRCFEADETECTNKATMILESSDVTSRDIAILQVQAEDITTTEQKLFIVHTIYDYLETLQDKKDKILKKNKGNVDEASKYTKGYDAQIVQLNDILKRVMSVDVSGDNRRYGVFVKYPKGYEG